VSPDTISHTRVRVDKITAPLVSQLVKSLQKTGSHIADAYGCQLHYIVFGIQYKYLGTRVTDKNYTRKGVKSRSNSGKLWSENLTGRDHSEDLGIDGKIILEWILGRYCGEV